MALVSWTPFAAGRGLLDGLNGKNEFREQFVFRFWQPSCKAANKTLVFSSNYPPASYNCENSRNVKCGLSGTIYWANGTVLFRDIIRGYRQLSFTPLDNCGSQN